MVAIGCAGSEARPLQRVFQSSFLNFKGSVAGDTGNGYQINDKLSEGAKRDGG
jgi:hypothetical protein